MRKTHLSGKILCLMLSIIVLANMFPCAILSADDTEPSESQEEQQEITISNPIDGLLDPVPENAPFSDSRAFLIYDALSDTMLIGSDYDIKREPASITQIMTVLLAIEELQISDEIEISSDMYSSIPEEYVRIGFNEGEIVTVEQCLYACILKSANDAAMALAIYISGSEEAFVEKMNQRAQELGCTSTHFTNPYGLSDPEHYTTCHDMALIMKEALKHDNFISISTTTSYTMDPTNKYNDKRVMNNGNRFISTPSLAYEYYIGGKTGYTENAGYTIIAGAEKEGKTLIGILLGAQDAEARYSTLISLFEYCFLNYTTTKVEPTEFSDIEATTITQISGSLENTNLQITDRQFVLLDYYSIELSVANQGYSNSIDMSGIVIDPPAAEQEFALPIYRHFSAGITYKIGYMVIKITDPTQITPVEEANEKDDKTNVGHIVLIVAVSIALLSIVVGSIIIFFKLTKKRKFLKTHKNPRIL